MYPFDRCPFQKAFLLNPDILRTSGKYGSNQRRFGVGFVERIFERHIEDAEAESAAVRDTMGDEGGEDDDPTPPAVGRSRRRTDRRHAGPRRRLTSPRFWTVAVAIVVVVTVVIAVDAVVVTFSGDGAVECAVGLVDRNFDVHFLWAIGRWRSDPC